MGFKSQTLRKYMLIWNFQRCGVGGSNPKTWIFLKEQQIYFYCDVNLKQLRILVETMPYPDQISQIIWHLICPYMVLFQ